MSQHSNFDIGTASGLEELDLQIRREDVPIEIEKRKRSNNNYERRALTQLPARVFELPPRQHHDRESHGQPHANPAGYEQRQRRRRDGGVGIQSEIRGKGPELIVLELKQGPIIGERMANEGNK